MTEPGHQLEWAWILANHQRLTGRDNGDIVTGLIGFAERHGVDPTSQITFNAVRDDGTPLDRGSRTWPNTERIKAAVAGFERHGRDPRPMIDTVPASTLYHVFLAFTELLRIAPAVEARFPAK